jgi:hypothetical protein
MKKACYFCKNYECYYNEGDWIQSGDYDEEIHVDEGWEIRCNKKQLDEFENEVCSDFDPNEDWNDYEKLLLIARGWFEIIQTNPLVKQDFPWMKLGENNEA